MPQFNTIGSACTSAAWKKEAEIVAGSKLDFRFRGYKHIHSAAKKRCAGPMSQPGKTNYETKKYDLDA